MQAAAAHTVPPAKLARFASSHLGLTKDAPSKERWKAKKAKSKPAYERRAGTLLARSCDLGAHHALSKRRRRQIGRTCRALRADLKPRRFTYLRVYFTCYFYLCRVRIKSPRPMDDLPRPAPQHAKYCTPAFEQGSRCAAVPFRGTRLLASSPPRSSTHVHDALRALHRQPMHTVARARAALDPRPRVHVRDLRERSRVCPSGQAAPAVLRRPADPDGLRLRHRDHERDLELPRVRSPPAPLRTFR
jgi:hypothetical protein